MNEYHVKYQANVEKEENKQKKEKQPLTQEGKLFTLFLYL